MLMQHVGVGYLGYHRAAIYAMKHSAYARRSPN